MYVEKVDIQMNTIVGIVSVRMAQWIRRLPTEQEILGSSPSTGWFFVPGIQSPGLMCFCPCQKKVLRARIELATFCV